MPITSSTSSMTLALSTTELLESILLHIPPQTLLPLHRVCHTWNALLRTSPILQRHLFLRADTHLVGKLAHDRPGARPRNNLALSRVLGGGGRQVSMTLLLSEFGSEEEMRQGMRERIRQDEAVEKRDTTPEPGQYEQGQTSPGRGPERWARNSAHGFWAWNVNVSFSASEAGHARTEDGAKRSAAISYEHASWRRMLVCQPPATKLYLTRRWRRSAEPAIEVESGITMQDLLDAASRGREAAWSSGRDPAAVAERDGAGGDRGRWNEVYIGMDGDWHLEGPILYSHFVGRDADGAAVRLYGS